MFMSNGQGAVFFWTLPIRNNPLGDNTEWKEDGNDIYSYSCIMILLGEIANIVTWWWCKLGGPGRGSCDDAHGKISRGDPGTLVLLLSPTLIHTRALEQRSVMVCRIQDKPMMIARCWGQFVYSANTVARVWGYEGWPTCRDCILYGNKEKYGW